MENTDEQLKKIEEYEYQIRLLKLFQEFLININNKLELNDLAEYLLKFIKNSFNVEACSIIINHQRFFYGNINSESIKTAENVVLEEAAKRKENVILNNINNDTLTFHLKPGIEKTLISMPILNEGKIIAYANIYENIKSFNFNEVKILQEFLNKASTSIHNSLAYNQVNKKSMLDPLTGVYNRRYFMQKLITQLNTFEKFLSIAMIDIDFFKNYNDKNGHQAGDQILAEIVNVIQDNLRDSDTMGRYGGEEFILILPEVDNLKALEICERLRKAIENHNFKFMDSQPENRITISAGLTTTVTKDLNYEELIKEADSNLYKSKKAGRNKVTNSLILNKNLHIS